MDLMDPMWFLGIITHKHPRAIGIYRANIGISHRGTLGSGFYGTHFPIQSLPFSVFPSRSFFQAPWVSSMTW